MKNHGDTMTFTSIAEPHSKTKNVSLWIDIDIFLKKKKINNFFNNHESIDFLSTIHLIDDACIGAESVQNFSHRITIEERHRYSKKSGHGFLVQFSSRSGSCPLTSCIAYERQEYKDKGKNDVNFKIEHRLK